MFIFRGRKKILSNLHMVNQYVCLLMSCSLDSEINPTGPFLNITFLQTNVLSHSTLQKLTICFITEALKGMKGADMIGQDRNQLLFNCKLL